MSGWHVLSVESIHWIWLVCGLLGWWGWRVFQECLQVRYSFAGVVSLHLSKQRLIQQWIRISLTGLGMCSAVVALMQPVVFGQESVQETSIEADVVVALDVSKSMLAEDAPPNRLERAKYEVMEMVDAMPDYRFALVGFAGSASVLCPLTKDVGFFQLVLNNASPDSISRGGTSIGAAMQKGLDAFAGGTAPKLLVIITDGEDHDSDPIGATEAAVSLGIPVVTIGFGSEDGSPITLTDSETGAKTELKDRDGNTVISRLDGELLREIALKTDGAFIPAGVASIDLEGIVKAHITPLVSASSVRQTTTQFPVHGRWIGLALILVILAQMVDTPLVSRWFREEELGGSV